MKIINPKNKTIQIKTLTEMKDVILTLAGGQKNPVDIVIEDEKISQDDFFKYIRKPIGEIYPDFKSNEKIDGYDEEEEISVILSSCRFALEECQVKNDGNSTIITFTWFDEDNH